MRVFKFFVAASILFAFVTSANAQSVRAHKQFGNAPTTSLVSRATNGSVSVIGSDQVFTITNNAVGIGTSHDENRIDNVIGERTSGNFEPLSHGAPLHFAVPVSTTQISTIFNQKTVNVNVGYEPRAIGGILTIKVELIPLFEGIGVATRSTAHREFACAVEDLDQDFVSNTISRLTNELLAIEYANK